MISKFKRGSNLAEIGVVNHISVIDYVIDHAYFSALQRVAAHCSMLQRVAAYTSDGHEPCRQNHSVRIGLSDHLEILFDSKMSEMFPKIL